MNDLCINRERINQTMAWMPKVYVSKCTNELFGRRKAEIRTVGGEL